MLIYDLNGRGLISESAHFIIIGGGTAGLVAAVRLAQRTGQKVVCLESGGLRQDDDAHPFNEVIQTGALYRGADSGRFRCIGGTSTRWGGAMIPFQPADLDSSIYPIAMDDLMPYVAELEALFDLDGGVYSDPAFPFSLGQEHVNRMAKWPPFKKRNVAQLLNEPIRSEANLQVWFNAHVTDIHSSVDGVIVHATSINGDKIDINARKLIIAAGAIETTRLALLIDRTHENAVSSISPAVGRYFSDHISIEVGEIDPLDRSKLNEIIGFRFGPNGSMRNIRFELAPDASVRKTLPPSFTHIGFASETRGGFDVLREIYQYLQRRCLPPLGVGIELLSNMPWLLRAVWWRFKKKRLLFPQGARLLVHVVIEQEPIPENRISLSETRHDIFGTPLAEIHWNISELDKKNLLNTAKLFLKSWNESDFSKLGKFNLFNEDEVCTSLADTGGIFHPTGSTRMSADPSFGAVDPDLNLFGVPNVQLLATSVLPTGGGANPTMMLLLLTLRCVDQHRKKLAHT
ncbi:GMC oxidoreductase [Novosphingobium resinovorum]|uniref:GMC oxidoreductase n=1 Tax=Novosphingobium TaxID=165696 RepID=UPI001B3C5713|nr:MULTISPECIES: GMC oxidoreductase [Novosphingobium]MBF7012788.1 GMC family oxidoreductase [Novosphingobium sp. HR1a]WJM27522.1 GMC oxidoreductase [Novosphingobium resinovorum]